MAADERFKVLTDEERSRALEQRRRNLETELWQQEINKVGSTDKSVHDQRIEEIESALGALDGLDPVS